MPAKTTPVPLLPDSADAQLGAKLRAARLEHGLSQKQLGEVAGVSFQQMQKYEKGTNRVASSTLQKFALALGLPIEHFFEDRADIGQLSAPSRAPYVASAIEGAPELLRLYEQLNDPEARTQLLQLARLLDGNQVGGKPRRK